MSKPAGRFVLIAVVVLGLTLGLLGSLANRASARTARTSVAEFTIEARGMAFYLEDSASGNPTLTVAPGDTVRIRLINRDRGMQHDLVLPELDAGTKLLTGDGASTTFEFQAPQQPGVYEYVCTLHQAMMRGRLVVRG